MADEIIQSIKIEGVPESTSAFDRLAQAGEKTFDRLKQAGERVGNIGASLDKVGTTGTRALSKVEKAAEALGRSIGTTVREIGGLVVNVAKLAATAGAATAGGIFALAKSASTVTGKVRDAAIAAGTTAENLAKLGFAAEQSGSNLQGLQRAFGILAAGEDKVSTELAKFGVQLKNSNGTARDSTEVFRDFASAISQIQDPAQQAAAAASVFGVRAGPRLVELLSLGRKGIEKLGEEAQRLGLVFSKAEVTIGDDFGDSLDKLGRVLQAVGVRIGLAFSPALIELMDRLSDAIAQAAPHVTSLANALGSALLPVVKSITGALGPTGIAIAAVVGGIGALGIAIKTAAVILGPFAGIARAAFLPFTLLAASAVSAFKVLTGTIGIVINAVRLFGLVAAVSFGPVGLAITALVAAFGFLAVVVARSVDWTSFSTAGTSAVTAIVSIFTNGANAILGAWRQLEAFFVALWAGINADGTTIWAAIVAAATAAVAAISEAVSPIVAALQSVWDGIKSAAESAWNGIVSAAQSAFSQVQTFIQPVVDAIQNMIDLARRAASVIGSLAGIGASSSGGTPGLAQGGPIRGPGTKTSDSILARLSRGEYVIRAAAVDKYGVRVLDAINGMRLPLRALRGFAVGGLVDALQMPTMSQPRYAFAEGGAVGGGGRPVVLNIDRETFNMTAADGDTADRLVRFANVRRVRSAGKKPGYYGAGR